MASFFVDHGFTRPSNSSLLNDFDRLAQQSRWSKETKKQKKLQLVHAIVHQLEEQLSRIDALRVIIQRYGLLRPHEAMPPSVRQCRAIVRVRLFVNLWDLADGNDRKFETLAELQDYTRRRKRYMPREQAKASTLCREMMHRMSGGRGRAIEV